MLGSLGKRIKAALLCKTLPKDDNPAEYVNGSSSSPSRNLVTAIKLAGYVVHCGTGGKVSAVDGDGREVRETGHNERLCVLFCIGSSYPWYSSSGSEQVLERVRALSSAHDRRTTAGRTASIRSSACRGYYCISCRCATYTRIAAVLVDCRFL